MSDTVAGSDKGPADGRRAGLGGDYWWMWTSSTLSNLADGVLKVALPLAAIEYTRSPVMIAGLTFAFTLPWLLFALPAGAVADRVDRRKLMLSSNGLRALLLAVLLLAALFDAGSVWLLYTIAILTGVVETFHDTAAQSILPQIVDRHQLPRANSMLYSAETIANEFAAPPLAGFLVTTGLVITAGTPAFLWVVAVTVLLFVHGAFRTPRASDHPKTTLRTDVVEGARFLVHHKLLRTITAMTSVFNFASSATQAILVLYAVGPVSAMGLTATEYGWLLSLTAVGYLIGSLVTDKLVQMLGRARSIGLSFLVSGASIGIPAITDSAVVIGVIFFIGGFWLVINNVTTVSLRQLVTPDRLLGRINSTHRLAAYGTKPLGAITGGLLSQLISLQVTFAIMGCVVFVALIGMTTVTDKAMDTAERGTHQA